jgi:histone acetyltransferase (RNA polymerase elongator complex component)
MGGGGEGSGAAPGGGRARIVPLFLPFAACPHRCVYCQQELITGHGAGGDADGLRAELARMISLALARDPRPVEVAFYGGSFTGLPPEEQRGLLSLAVPHREEGRVRGVRISTRPDLLDQAAVALLAEGGVTCVEVGAPSLDEEVLRRSGRGHGAGDVIRAADLVRRGGLELGLQMMTGLPGDTPDGSLETARALADLGPAFVRIYPTLVIRGTPLETLWREGCYRPAELEETVELLSRLLPLFTGRGIAVARVGLHHDVAREVLAGPWHPSLGWLARREAAVPGPPPMARLPR